MKFYNSFYAPSISVAVRGADHTLRNITLPSGEGNASNDDMEVLRASEVIHAFVKDGYLHFPNCPVLGPLYNQTKQERLDREKELFNAEEETPDISGDLAALTDLVGKQARELNDAKTETVDAVEANKKLNSTVEDLMKRISAMEDAAKAAKTAVDKAPKTAPVAPAASVAAPAAPAAPVAPVAPAPAAPPVAPPAAPTE